MLWVRGEWGDDSGVASGVRRGGKPKATRVCFSPYLRRATIVPLLLCGQPLFYFFLGWATLVPLSLQWATLLPLLWGGQNFFMARRRGTTNAGPIPG